LDAILLWGFVGNTTSTYAPQFPAVETHQQRGYYNVKIVLDWLHIQQSSGSSITSPLSKLVVAGDSAGAAGAIIWADKLLSEFPSSSAAIISDCPPIVIPDSVYSMVFSNWGACTSPLLSAALQKTCKASQPFGLADIALSVMANNPTVPFVYIISKLDNVLWAYYCVYAGDYFGFPQISLPEYNELLVKAINKLNQSPNFITFLVDSMEHTYTVDDQSLMTSTTYGLGAPVGSSLISFLDKLPLSNGESISSLCNNCADLGFYPKVYLQKPSPAPPKGKTSPKKNPKEPSAKPEPAPRLRQD